MNIPSVSMPHGAGVQMHTVQELQDWKLCRMTERYQLYWGSLKHKCYSGNSDTAVLFTAKIYDANGTDSSANLANVQWRLVYDFNDTNTSNLHR